MRMSKQSRILTYPNILSKEEYVKQREQYRKNYNSFVKKHEEEKIVHLRHNDSRERM